MSTETVIECGTLIDGTSDEPRHDVFVVVEEGTVTDVGSPDTVTTSADADRIDHADDVVLPGLVDAHLHLMGERSMEKYARFTERLDPALCAARATQDLRSLLRAGFTTVRDVGSTTGVGLRRAVSEGSIPGPSIYTSGQTISQTAGHGDHADLPHEWLSDTQVPLRDTLVDGPDECRKEARKRIRDGVDLLKISTTGGVISRDRPEDSQFTLDEIRVITEEAHRVGIPVASHAQGTQGIKNALKAGVDTIEHAFFLDEEAIEMVDREGAVLVPTLAIARRIAEVGADHGVPESAIGTIEETHREHLDSTRRAYEAGLPIALGTDFLGPDLVPHGENALEAEIFVEDVGMSEMDAIRAATSVAARTLPDEDVGAVTAGKRADLVVPERDPLEDITALYDVSAVYQGGRAVDL